MGLRPLNKTARTDKSSLNTSPLLTDQISSKKCCKEFSFQEWQVSVLACPMVVMADNPQSVRQENPNKAKELLFFLPFPVLTMSGTGFSVPRERLNTPLPSAGRYFAELLRSTIFQVTLKTILADTMVQKVKTDSEQTQVFH